MRLSWDRKRQIITFLYFLGIAGFLLITLLIETTKEGQLPPKETYTDISTCWTLDREGTQPVSVKELGEHMDPAIGQISIYYRLPEMTTDKNLSYRSKDVYTKVLIDGELLYETTVFESDLYNLSPGNLWNILTVSSAYSGKCIELQVRMVYDTGSVVVDSLLLGDTAAVILDFLETNLYDIVISLALTFIGIFLMIFDFLPTYGRVKKHHGLFWVGVFAFLTGLFCLIETNMLQFWVDDMRMIQLVSNMLMLVIGMPLIFYLNCEYAIFKRRSMRIVGYVCTGYTFICFILHFTDILDLHYTITGGVIIILIADILAFSLVISMMIKNKKEKKPIMNCILQLTGLCSFWLLGLLEFIRSSQVDRIDRAGLIRVGVLILCLCFAAGSQLETYKILEQGLEYNFVKKLAYCDGLTGVGNRTAYLEQLDTYRASDKVGIVYLDINNLKVVNDTLGHELGDELIRNCSEIIEKSFGKFGKVYRVGGDEFCVLLVESNLDNAYAMASAMFTELINSANTEGLHPYEIQIAHGFSICKSATRDRIEKAVSDADRKMYENKKKIKSITT